MKHPRIKQIERDLETLRFHMKNVMPVSAYKELNTAEKELVSELKELKKTIKKMEDK